MKSRFTFFILVFRILLFGCRVALRRRPQIPSNSVFSVVHDVNMNKYLRQTRIVWRFPDVLPSSSSCFCRADYAAEVKASRTEPSPSSPLASLLHSLPMSNRKGGGVWSFEVKGLCILPNKCFSS